MPNDAVLPEALTCPKCQAQMRIHRYPENDAYRCEGCQGLWLPLMAHEQLEERAAEIGKALVERGVPAARIRTEGFSSRRPVASNTTPDGRRLNRRVEVVLLEEKVENITKGEPEGAFASAWDQLKTLIDQGLVKPVEKP